MDELYIYMGAQRFGGTLEEHAEDSRFKILRKTYWTQILVGSSLFRLCLGFIHGLFRVCLEFV